MPGGVIFSKSSGLQDSIYGKSEHPIRLFIEERAEAYKELSIIPRMFYEMSSSNFAEKFTGMTPMGEFKPVGEGGAYPMTEMQEGYAKIIEPEEWKQSFSITQAMIEDNKILELRGRPLGFMNAWERTRELFGAELFIAAINGGKVVVGGKEYVATGADGKHLFALDHPSVTKRAKPQSNKFSNVFSDDALAAAETAMQNFTDDNGNVLNVAPDTIVIPNDGRLKKAVFATIGADKDPDTSNNGFNFLFGRWNVVVCPYLNGLIPTNATDPIPWMLLDSKYNDTYGGAIWVDRIPLTIKSSIDENTDNNVWRGRARFMAGFNDWRFAAVCGLAGGTALAV